MAAANSAANSLSMFEELLQCLICFEQFKNPKELACHHTFCEDCLQRWMKQNKGGCTHVIVCPTCRVVTHLPKGGINSLPSDFKLNRLSEILQNVDINGTEKTVCGIFCDVCSHRQVPSVARFKCEQCANHLCAECVADHDATVVFQGHTLHKVADQRVVRKYYCKLHAQKSLEYICTTCNTVICSICCQTQHRSHNVQDIDSILTPIRDNLKYSLKELESKLSQLQFTSQIHRLHNVDKQMAHSFIEAEENINKLAKVCIQRIQEHEQRLLEELYLKKANAAKQLQYLYEDVTFQQGCMDNLHSFLQRILRMNDPVEMYAMQGQLNDRIDSLLNETVIEIPELEEFCTVQFQPAVQINELGKLLPAPLTEIESLKCCPLHGPSGQSCMTIQKELENNYAISDKRKCCQHATSSGEDIKSPSKSPVKLSSKFRLGKKSDKKSEVV